MTADVRTFRAASMQAALDIVRRELGEDAVILHTRQIEKRGLVPFFSRRQQEVEITARQGQPPRPVKAQRASFETPTETLAPAPTLLDMIPRPLLEEALRTADTDTVTGSPIPTLREGRHNVVPPRWSPKDVINDRPAPAIRAPARPVAAASTSVTAPRGTASSKAASAMTIAARARLQPDDAPTVARPTTTRLDVPELAQRIDTLQKMILELGRERAPDSLLDVPPELFSTYTRMLDQEIDEETARSLITRVRAVATPAQLQSTTAIQTLLTGLVEQDLQIAPPVTATRRQRRTVALVGPTGVGKTTTLAKIAANLRLREGLTVGLITVDTYRIAAVEQLKTYAELIELPMKVVTTPDEMRTAISELSHLDVVLIDTAGRSPRDEVKIKELRDCLDAAQADEVHLVLSLASGMSALETIARNFRPVGLHSLILSKLDEANGTGSMLTIARQFRLPVSYLTTGQNVPDDIEPAHKTRMARLILGLDRIGA